LDRLEYTGDIELDVDGSAKLALRQAFYGKYALGLRSALEQVPEPQLRGVVETRLLGSALPGAKLDGFEVLQRDELDKPALIEMKASLQGFAEVRPGQLLIEPPLMPRLARLASLPVRQTPLLLRESTHQSIKLSVRLRPGTRVLGVNPGVVEDGPRKVSVKDRVNGNVLTLEREILLPAGRISVADYPRFMEFTRAAGALISRPIVVELGRGEK
jgi:cellulose synthase operon protein C